MMGDGIKRSIQRWWSGGEAVEDHGSLVIFRVPQSYPQRLRSNLVRLANRPYGVALIAGIIVAAIAKLLHLA
jgi:hypothetical protein